MENKSEKEDDKGLERFTDDLSSMEFSKRMQKKIESGELKISLDLGRKQN